MSIGLRGTCIAGTLALGLSLKLAAAGFTGPAEWSLVNTNRVAEWQAEQLKSGVARGASWRGVVADTERGEVRLLAEAVGHEAGITAEFLLIGPFSDRAYESAAVTVAMPGDIARAMERIGVARGGGIGSRALRIWAYGERVGVSVRRLDRPDQPLKPLQSLIRDAEPDEPMVGKGGLVFTGGRWDSSGKGCLTDTNMPSSVISLYNEPSTIFDIPFQAGQSEVYGRLSLAEKIPYATLLEVVIRPLAEDGKPRVLPLDLRVMMDAGVRSLVISGPEVGSTLYQGELRGGIEWMQARSGEGRDIYATINFDHSLSIREAAEFAGIFVMLDGKGIKLDGKGSGSLFPRAFLPQERWRERQERVPQPFELHLRQKGDGNYSRKLVFIEEDWSVEGLDPKLIPHEHPFKEWGEFLPLVEKSGGKDNKVTMLFVFAPATMRLSDLIPGIEAVAERLPLVYVFADDQGGDAPAAR